jgi:hypothetical protein
MPIPFKKYLAATVLAAAATALGWQARHWFSPAPATPPVRVPDSSPAGLQAEVPASVHSANATSDLAEVPHDPATLPGQPAELARQISTLQPRLAIQEAELARIRRSFFLLDNLQGALIEESNQKARERTAENPSLFKDLAEAGQFIAVFNQRALDYFNQYQKPGAQGSPDSPEANALWKQLSEDAASFANDPILYKELSSGDPQRFAQVQLAYIAPTIGLDATQSATLQTILSEAYTEGAARNLSMADKPVGDATAWERGRRELNARTVARFVQLLTPAQQERSRLFGYDQQLLYSLNMGGVEAGNVTSSKKP